MARVVRLLAAVVAVALLSGCRAIAPSGNATPTPSTDAERQSVISGLLAEIPSDASLSAQSDLMSNLGTRGSTYLFPVVGDAEYVLADVAASQDPAVITGLYQKVQELLGSGQFGVVDGGDGLLLLKRGLSGQTSLPDRFYDFLRATPDQKGFPLHARFGDSLELVAYNYETSEGRLTKLDTYWRALRPPDGDYKMVYFVSPSAGAETEAYDDSSPATIWYPTSRWHSGELVKLDFDPALVDRDTGVVRVAVYQQGQQARVALPVTLADGATQDQTAQVLDLAQAPSGEVSLADFIDLPYEAASTSQTAAPTPTSTPIPAALSLCGKPLSDPSLARLRPVAIKIDNAPGAQPQAGLDQACVVYEHIAEGGITRFTAIYQTEDTQVGPVRSARRVDLHIVPQYQAFFGHVGGAPAEMALIKQYQLLDVDQFFHSEAYYYSSQRQAPHNVFTSVSAIRKTGESLGYGSEATLEGYPFSEDAPQGGTPATDIIIPYPGSSQAEFRYDSQSGDYVRFTGGQPHIDATTGKAVRTTNVIVQQVPIWPVSNHEDVNGATSYDMDLVGQGHATIFRNGKAIDATWVRSSLYGWTRFLDDAGQPIPLDPGKIWISLISSDDHVTVH